MNNQTSSTEPKTDGGQCASTAGLGVKLSKQIVLEVFPHACMGRRSGNGLYAVMQSPISWGDPVGSSGKTQREAWENAATNIPNWIAYMGRRTSTNV